MDRARIAEWILRRVVGKEKAAALVGDEIETQPGATAWRFWAATIGLVLAVSWRNAVALIAAPVLGVLVDLVLWLKIDAPHEILILESGRQQSMMPTMMFVSSLSGLHMLLWGQAVFALIRFGARDAFSKASLLSAISATLAASLAWSTHGRGFALILLTGLVGFQLIAPDRRAAFGVCLLVLAVDWTLGGWLLRALRFHPFWGPGTVLLVVPVVGGATAIWFHQQFLERRGRVEVA